MTVSHLAEYLKVSHSTIYRLLRSGHIPFSLKRGNGFYFHRHEIDRWLAEQQAKN
jgi:excisionase family DNA binding protein